MRLTLFGVTALLLPLLLACIHPSLEARLQLLEVEADRQAVIRLMHAYAQGLDSLDEELLRRTFTEDAVAEYVAVNYPLNERLEGRDAILAWLRKSVGDRGNSAPWHYMSTAMVEVEGDRGTLRTFQHNRTLRGIGVYTVEARRTAEGWQIAKLHLDTRSQENQLVESPELGGSPTP